MHPSTAAPAPVCINAGTIFPKRVVRWTRWDLNPGPLPCKGSALPAELRALGRSLDSASTCITWEVIQPQIPLCSNVAKTTPSHEPHSGGLTGGVCKEQGRIHRAMLKRDYYGFQLHEGEFQPSIRTKNGFKRLPSPFGVGTHCPIHCSPRVARRIRGILTYRRPLLPPL